MPTFLRAAGMLPLLVAVALTACSAPALPDPSVPDTVDADGRTYIVSCAAVRPEMVRALIVTVDRGGGAVAVHAVAGVSADQVVALDTPGGGCFPGEETSPWSLAFVDAIDPALLCPLVFPERARVDGCS
jgi:hypothetical protein